jgi:hypothetical protein
MLGLAASGVVDWGRLSRVAPDTEIEIRLRGQPLARRYYLAADDLGLIVLNDRSPALTHRLRRALHKIASTAPDRYRSLLSGAAQYSDGEIAVRHDGVFVRTLKVAEIDEVIESFPPSDIETVCVVAHPKARAASIGAGVGLILMLLGGGPTDCADCPGQVIGGLAAGTALAAGIGTLWASGPNCEVVYVSHAP